MILAITATSTYADNSNMQPALRGGAVVADFVQELAQLEDSHGCNTGSTGYTWCAPLNKCVRTWETPCVKPSPKPDVCIPGIGLNWQCYPKGYGDGLPPCCNRYGNNHAGHCNNGNYNNADIQCTAPGLCTAKFGDSCYKSSGMPMCCRSNGGSGCNYNSNLDCDASDSHGCNTGSTGYTWCAKLQMCLAPGKPCVAPRKPVGCNPSTGYTWCAKLQRCARSYECYPSLENAFMNYLTDINENDENNIDDREDDEDTIIETYTEGNPREGNLRG